MTTDVGRQLHIGRRHDPSPFRVGLLGGFGGGNIGNDASLDAVIRMVQRIEPDAVVTCLCPQPEEVADRFRIPAHGIRARRPGGGIFASPIGRALRSPYRLGDFSRALRMTGSLDALLIPGTGILDDYGGERPMGWPLTLAEWLTAARVRGVRTGMVSIGAGPLEDPAARWLASLACRFAGHRSYRDAGSRNFLAGIGLDVSADDVVPDIVFSLPSPAPVTAHAAPLVVVPVMKYRGWNETPRSSLIEDQHAGVLGAFCSWLLRTGYAVRLVTADIHDHAATKRVAQSITVANPEAARSRLTTEVTDDMAGFLRLVADATAVVASRYHAVIGALICGKPTISLGYAAKNQELMAGVGLGAYCQHLDRLDEMLLRKQFLELVAHRHRLSTEITRRVAAFRAELAAEEDRLHAFLGHQTVLRHERDEPSWSQQ
jgi:polysaccharide pyruvyl transferase WcaK-like protein